jgi:hypothetical protein
VIEALRAIHLHGVSAEDLGAMMESLEENARRSAVMVGQAAAESAVRSDTESALLAPRAKVITPC